MACTTLRWRRSVDLLGSRDLDATPARELPGSTWGSSSPGAPGCGARAATDADPTTRWLAGPSPPNPGGYSPPDGGALLPVLARRPWARA
jgi:hypothetical protein